MFWQTLFMLVVLTLFCVAAYFTTRFLGKKLSPSMSSGRNMEIIERLGIAQDKALLLVRIDEKAFLLAVTKQTITMLTETPIPQSLPQPAEPNPMQGLLQGWDWLKHRVNPNANLPADGEEVTPDELPASEREKFEQLASRLGRSLTNDNTSRIEPQSKDKKH